MLFEPGYGPLLDICDEGERLVIYVDLPGVQREDIKLRVLADSLELEATRQTPKEAIHRERLNRFYRMFSLPYSVKAEKVAAKQENGVLTITLPKAEGRSVSVE
jgi:HSP20 family protein